MFQSIIEKFEFTHLVYPPFSQMEIEHYTAFSQSHIFASDIYLSLHLCISSAVSSLLNISDYPFSSNMLFFEYPLHCMPVVVGDDAGHIKAL